MKILKFIVIPFAAFLLLLQSCSSPMDVDTPRDKKKIIGEDYKLQGEISDIYFEENGYVKPFKDNDAYFEIDTALGLNALWMRLSLEDFQTDPAKLNRICIQNINLELDSVNFDRPYIFDGRLSSRNKCRITIARGLNTSNDTLTLAGQNANSTEMTFDYIKEDGVLWLSLHTKIHEQKIWLEYRDSTYIDYITVTRLDTTYDNNGNMIIKEIKEQIPKEVTVKIEEEKRMNDSLFLNGRFKIKF